MLTMDDAVEFLIGDLLNPRSGTRYGYDLFLPIVTGAYLQEIVGASHGRARRGDVLDISPVFYDAAWLLCRRGILRPGIKSHNQQPIDDGSNGYSITAYGREWLQRVGDDVNRAALEPGRFNRIIAGFAGRLGPSFTQRAAESSRCYQAAAYLACCVMCGAAAESILLNLAVTKTGDEEGVFRQYQARDGRRTVENLVLGQVRRTLADEVRTYLDLLKYWRDAAAHGAPTEIEEFHAYEAQTRLLRLAYSVERHWTELTG